MMTARTVAIIGAGASGLAAAKVLLEDGFDVTIFDRQKKVGGIWSPDWAYADLHTQLVAGFMEFSNLLDHEGNLSYNMNILFIRLILAKDYAPWQNIHNYLQKYADKFHLFERIRFQTKVILIDKVDLKDPHLPWIIKVEPVNGCHQTLKFDFVVVANGLFSTPYIPVFQDQDKFAGSIVHATEIKTWEQLKNKRVAVIGGGKSAVDLATLAGMYAQSCYMIFRRSHWLIPHKLLHGYLPFQYTFTRLFTTIFDPFPYAPHSDLFYFIHRHFSFIIKKIFDSVSDYIITTYGSNLFENEIFIPQSSLRNTENSIRVTEEFIKLNREGRVIRKVASVDKIIDDTTVRLDSGDLLQADLIVCATGFIENFSFLSETLSRALGQNKTTLTSNEGVDLDLYRRIIPVGIPNIAFIGLPATANTWMFFEVQCHWTSDYFLGRLKLPTTEKEMYEEIRTIRYFIQKLFNRKSYYFQYYWLEPIEIYLQDMGLQLHRTNNWISEYFGVYRPKRIATLHDERQAKGHRHWYFGFGYTLLLLLVLLLFICVFF
jgi:dimethylaniline monooxygenase (N-oxide forming)